MINTIQAHVIGASRYSMDNGVKGAKVTIMQPSASDNDNQLGNQVSTMSAPYEILGRPAAKPPCTSLLPANPTPPAANTHRLPAATRNRILSHGHKHT